MAKVVDCYSAVMNSTDNIFDRPDADGEHTQYDYGQELRLPANYAERETDGFYPVTYPENGWIKYYIVTEITPIYKTVTDKCTPPTGLSITGRQMTIVGGAGGDLNTFTGYGISWRDAVIGSENYGNWSEDVVASSSDPTVTYAVTVPAGYMRQFRVRTLGSAGSDYYSEYVTCSTTLTGNTAPSAPGIPFPASGKATYCATPVVKVSIPADAEGDEMTLYRMVDSGDWVSVGTTTGGSMLDTLPTLSVGNHTIHYKLADSHGLESESISISVTYTALAWTRPIETGTVISNQQVSHKADISQMMEVLNTQSSWYGNDGITLNGTLGRFGDWKAQMEQMEAAITANAASAGKTAAFETVPGYPAAGVINAIRTQLTAF